MLLPSLRHQTASFLWLNQAWAEAKDPKKPGAPDNPLGRAQLVYDPPRTVHGTNEPQSIGKASSHGCIRMAKRDLEELFARVNVGDTVEIRGERDEQTAGIFGAETVAAATTQATESGDSAGQ